MKKDYLETIMSAMTGFKSKGVDLDDFFYASWAALGRLCGSPSTLQLAKLAEIPDDRFYSAIQELQPGPLKRKLRNVARKRLARHLQKLQCSSPATRSRGQVTICVDDFVRRCRGKLGGWAGLWYSGADKKVVMGVRFQVLSAVIGDSKEEIILETRIVPTPPEGRGRPPDKPNLWLEKKLISLENYLRKQGASLKGIIVSADSAYVSKSVIRQVKKLEMVLVSEVSANRKVEGYCDSWLYCELQAKITFSLWTFLQSPSFRPLRGFPDEEVLRGHFSGPSLGDIVVLAVTEGPGEIRFLFSTQPTMMSIRIRRAARRRWRLERMFWNLKQNLGIKDIHHHTQKRVEVRCYLAMIALQIVLDLAKTEGKSVGEIIRVVDRSLHLPDIFTRFQHAFSCGFFQNAVLPEELCA